MKTTTVGFVNRNAQRVLRATGLPGPDPLQTVYVLQCGKCDHEYGSFGTDILGRKCPNCHGGAPGFAVE